MKCFVAIASLLGASTAEPFWGNTYGAGYSVAPPMYQAPVHAVPASMLRMNSYNAATYSVLPEAVASATPVQYAAQPMIPAAPAAVQYAAQPVMRTAPAARITVQPTGVTAQQYHSQDEFGNYAYGYANQNSQKQEAGNVNLGVRGSYSYDAGHGLNRRVDYVADGLGFRVTGNAISPAANSLMRFKRSMGMPATLLRTKTYNAATYTTLPDAAMMAASPAVHYAEPMPAMTYAAEPAMTYAAEPAMAYAQPPMHAAQPAVYTAPTARIAVQPTGITAMQHHSQDEFGNYAYGYSNPNGQKTEQGNVNTAVTGSFNYNVAPGLNRRVDYIADAAGFRVVGNYINRMKRSLGLGGFRSYAAVPTAAQAPANLLRTNIPNAATYTTIPDAAMSPAVQYAAAPAMTYAVPAKMTYAARPAVTYASPMAYTQAAAPMASQYHSQDEFTNFAYGYANPNSQKQEVGNANGVQGHYSFVDAYGLPRRVDYVADAFGFRASKHF